ncbi:Rrf2 family transcriptional regulator [Synechococcus sp. LTW-R]|uniref:RrF2 family transcriptional regulator n=1 Tax=Synechococcus sp. LTW-R TaxID=2751170 RepID=UPI002105561F|nr:Rrf2 family transcriptional regulator [Synechococcus sp. LTW-R]
MESTQVAPLSFNAKTRYGLLALLELAGIEARGGRLQVSAIAQRQDIPERYLEQLLTSLRKEGLLNSSRGPRGGYQLTRPAATIHLSEVLDCLEGRSEPEQAVQPSLERQVLHALDTQLTDQRRTLLESTTLADLLAQRDARLQAQAMYFI